jgi:hypothetical protein
VGLTTPSLRKGQCTRERNRRCKPSTPLYLYREIQILPTLLTGNPAAVKTTLSVRALPVILVWIIGNPVQVASITQRTIRYQRGCPREGFPGGTWRGLTVDLREVHVQAQSGTKSAKRLHKRDSKGDGRRVRMSIGETHGKTLSPLVLSRP